MRKGNSQYISVISSACSIPLSWNFVSSKLGGPIFFFGTQNPTETVKRANAFS
jgi:hypothetical protein